MLTKRDSPIMVCGNDVVGRGEGEEMLLREQSDKGNRSLP